MNPMKANNVMFQASETIALYMRTCAFELDEFFGEGYAKNNPELLAVMIQSCVEDFRISISLAGID